jgi:hypothetical protein
MAQTQTFAPLLSQLQFDDYSLPQVGLLTTPAKPLKNCVRRNYRPTSSPTPSPIFVTIMFRFIHEGIDSRIY